MKRLQERNRERKAEVEGPVWVGQVVSVDVQDDDGAAYTVVWLPDRNNDLLREAGKPMHFYYLPEKPRLDRDEDGHYKFHLQKFSGVMDPTKNIGEEGYDELTGGCLTFTSTLGLPEPVLKRAFEQLKQEMSERGQSDAFFGQADGDPAPINGGPIALRANKTVLHELRFDGGGEPAGNGESAGSSESAGDGDPEAWSFEVQGAGEGALNLQASNAFTVMLGNRPVQMLLGSAESGDSQVTLENHIRYAVWTMVTKVEITAEWENVYDHFSMNIKGKSFLADVDYKKITDEMVNDGVVTVKVSFGAGMVDPKEQERYEEAADAVADAFRKTMEEHLLKASQTPKEEAAKAETSDTDWFWYRGGGFAMKDRKDITKGSRSYKREISKQIERSDVLSSQMEGLFDELKNDEDAKDRYFSEVFFEEGFKKIHVVATSNAHWPSGNGEASGDPIRRLNLQVGYPDSRGNLVWKSAARFKDDNSSTAFSEQADMVSWTPDTRDRIYAFDFTRHDDLGEDADTIHLKKEVSLIEGPHVATNEIETSEVTDEHVVEVRSETAGKLDVGPIGLDMPIGSDQIKVLVTVKTDQFGEEVFEFNSENAAEPKHYSVWYARPEDVEPYEYWTEVIIEGKRFGQRALRWESDWTEREVGGPLEVEVPAIPSDLEAKVDAYLSEDSSTEEPSD